MCERCSLRGFMFIAGAALCGLVTGGVLAAAAAPPVSLEVLDPRAELSTPPPAPITARLGSLSQKKIGLLNNTKEGARALQPYLEKLLKEAEPTLQLKTWTIPYNDYPGKEKEMKDLAEWSDAVIGFIGD